MRVLTVTNAGEINLAPFSDFRTGINHKKRREKSPEFW
jgi:hypothetical protein